MARKRVKLVRIPNDSTRRRCLKKRGESFIKKVEELSILCGVEAFGAVYSRETPWFMAWPPNAQAKQVLLRYMAMPELERSKKMTTQVSYLQDEIKKIQEKQKTQLKRMTNLELTYLMNEVHYGKGLDNMDMVGLNCFSLLLKERLKDLRKKADFYQIKTENAQVICNLLGEGECNNGAGPSHLWPFEQYGIGFNPNMGMGSGSAFPTGGHSFNQGHQWHR
ncbi:Agamous-like MADS-box protein AGL80 [Linum perenne]